jgi:hypothetical protein
MPEPMKKFVFIFLMMIFISLRSFSQYYFYNDKYYDNNLLIEIGSSLGGMDCFTDLGKDTPLFKAMALCGGFYGGIIYHDILGVRLEATFGKVQAADSLNKGTASTRYRNLSFTSPITEFTLIGEIHPLTILNFRNGPPLLSPYILAGFGWFSFNPQTYYQGRWISLQPLHTEGEGFPEYPNVHNYSLSQPNIPVGAGIKYDFSPVVSLRGEFIYRFLFTDYLDDVSTNYIDPSLFAKYLSPANAALAEALYSRRNEIQPGYVTVPGSQRGDPRHNDTYYSFNIKLAVMLGRQKIQRRGHIMSCSKRY